MSILKSIHLEIYIGLIATIVGVIFFGIWMSEVFSNGSIKTWIPIAASTLLFIGYGRYDRVYIYLIVIGE